MNKSLLILMVTSFLCGLQAIDIEVTGNNSGKNVYFIQYKADRPTGQDWDPAYKAQAAYVITPEAGTQSVHFDISPNSRLHLITKSRDVTINKNMNDLVIDQDGSITVR
ncbi:hypothetical protein H0X06_03250 [Candidatus Dependentiae bacterium]|nr:hypothetical protein [Candidatus Dependentiae bacterium]